MTSPTPDSTAQQQPVAQRARLFYRLTLASLLALCALLLVWHLVLLPVSVKPWFIALLHVVPLLAFLPALLGRRPRPFVWLCFFILLYFCQGVINAFTLPSLPGVLGLLETLLTSSLFIAAMLAARYLAQAQAAGTD